MFCTHSKHHHDSHKHHHDSHTQHSTIAPDIACMWPALACSTAMYSRIESATVRPVCKTECSGLPPLVGQHGLPIDTSHVGIHVARFCSLTVLQSRAVQKGANTSEFML